MFQFQCMFILLYTPMAGCMPPGVTAKAGNRPPPAVAVPATRSGRPHPLTCMEQTIANADRKICKATGKQEKRVNNCSVPVYIRIKANGEYSERMVKPGADWSQCLLPQFDPGVASYKFCYADEADSCKGPF